MNLDDPFRTVSRITKHLVQDYRQRLSDINKASPLLSQSEAVQSKAVAQVAKIVIPLLQFHKVKVKLSQNELFFVKFVIRKKKFPLRIILTGVTFEGFLLSSFDRHPTEEKHQSKFEVTSPSAIFYQFGPSEPAEAYFLRACTRAEFQKRQSAASLGQLTISIDHAGKVYRVDPRKPKSTSRHREVPTDKQYYQAVERLKALRPTHKFDFVAANLKLRQSSRKTDVCSARVQDHFSKKMLRDFQSEKQKFLAHLGRNFPAVMNRALLMEQSVEVTKRNACLKILAACLLKSATDKVAAECNRVLKLSKNKAVVFLLVSKFIKRLKGNLKHSLSLRARRKFGMSNLLAVFHQSIRDQLTSQARQTLKLAFRRKLYAAKSKLFAEKFTKNANMVVGLLRRARLSIDLKKQVLETMFQAGMRNDKYLQVGLKHLRPELLQEVLAKSKQLASEEFTLYVAKLVLKSRRRQPLLRYINTLIVILKEKLKRQLQRRQAK